jgi:hypothetical protein
VSSAAGAFRAFRAAGALPSPSFQAFRHGLYYPRAFHAATLVPLQTRSYLRAERKVASRLDQNLLSSLTSCGVSWIR